MARGILISAIYTKTTEGRISSSTDGASLTLMSTDVERIFLGFRQLHEFWASCIEIALASWLLYNKLGLAFLTPIVIVVLCALAMSVVVKFTGDFQRRWMGGIQKRVHLVIISISIYYLSNLSITPRSATWKPIGKCPPHTVSGLFQDNFI